MILEFRYQNPHQNWCVPHVFKAYHNFIEKQFQCDHIETSNSSNRFGGALNSPHIMVVKNKKNPKYIIVSYWDSVNDLTFDQNGWDHKNCVEIITSSGLNEKIKTTPFSYLPYSKEFDVWSKESKTFEEKKNNELFFKGALYGKRLQLKKENILNISNKKTMNYRCYFEELNDNKICLSFNGAAEICNRDIEILATKSVLFRPKLERTKFHNEFIENIHYIPFEKNNDPKKQCEIILEKFEKIKNNDNFLKKVSENGYNWYLKNGTVESNVELLKKLINLEKLQ